MRRLFSTFAQGWPGAGLFLMRFVLGIALISRAVDRLTSAPSSNVIVLSVLSIGAGLLLLMGLWTPVAATLVAAIELWNIYWKLGDPWIYLLLATIAVAIAMLGPGFWSVDARLDGSGSNPPLKKASTDSPFRALSAIQTSLTCSSLKSSARP